MRQTNGLSIVKPTAIFETKGPWVSMVLLRRIAIQFLQARVREGQSFGQIHRVSPPILRPLQDASLVHIFKHQGIVPVIDVHSDEHGPWRIKSLL